MRVQGACLFSFVLDISGTDQLVFVAPKRRKRDFTRIKMNFFSGIGSSSAKFMSESICHRTVFRMELRLSLNLIPFLLFHLLAINFKHILSGKTLIIDSLFSTFNLAYADGFVLRSLILFLFLIERELFLGNGKLLICIMMLDGFVFEGMVIVCLLALTAVELFDHLHEVSNLRIFALFSLMDAAVFHKNNPWVIKIEMR